MSLETEMKPPLEGIWAGLEGSWKMNRSLKSLLSGFPSGTFTGTATIRPHPHRSRSSMVVANGLSQQEDEQPSHEQQQQQQQQYLYHERGTFITEQGLTFRANRKYIYRYSPQDNKISAWFVKESKPRSTPSNNTASPCQQADTAAGTTADEVEDEDEADYLYHELEFEKQDGRWIAKADHLCVNDMYWSLYDFRLEDDNGEHGECGPEGGRPALIVWGLRHKVVGPQKDYTSDTAYERIHASDRMPDIELPIRRK